jgi:hypothetical protein
MFYLNNVEQGLAIGARRCDLKLKNSQQSLVRHRTIYLCKNIKICFVTQSFT